MGRGPYEFQKPSHLPGLRILGGAWEQPWPGLPSPLPHSSRVSMLVLTGGVWPEGGPHSHRETGAGRALRVLGSRPPVPRSETV